MIKFNRRYFAIAIFLFLTEVFIALFVNDRIIRPYIGDFLVVILLYCLLKSVMNISIFKAAISVLLFSFLIEAMQYFRIVEVLGLQHSKTARIIIGSAFEWIDLAMYTGGILLILTIERYRELKGCKRPVC